MSASGPRRRTPVALVGATALVLTAAFGAAGTANAAKPDGPKRVDAQLLSFNDFHGQIENPTGSSANIRTGTAPNGDAINTVTGGAGYLSAHLQALRKPNSLTVAAGDLIGASPLLSAAFHDEPTIETMNALGLDVSSVGNHEFDEGRTELLRMQNGGCLADGDGANNQNSCPIPGHPFAGADFQYLSANVVDHATGDTLFPGVSVKTVGGQKIAFIGMTLEGTPSIVTPAGVAGLDFKDEVETANKLVPGLVRQGIKSIVVLLHEGGFPLSGVTYNNCPGISGPIVDIATHLSPQIDAVISGHTHQAYNCLIDDPDGQPRMVTSAASFGRIITEVNLQINTVSHDVVRSASTATNHLVTRDVTEDPAVTQIRSDYNTIIAPVRDKVVGSAAVTLTRTTATKPEADLGDAIADAQLASTAAPDKGGAQIAFMNAGGVRADLLAGEVTYGEAFNVQPFANILTTVTMTGANIKSVLEQQFYTVTNGTVSSRFLQPSTGFTYTWTNTAAAGSRVSDMKLNGVPIDPAASYRVTANNFLTTGGDGFTEFLNATNVLQGPIDLDSFVDYLGTYSPIGVPAGYPRINLVL